LGAFTPGCDCSRPQGVPCYIGTDSEMKAQYHPNSTEQVEVEILDIFVDRDGQPKMMFVREDGQVATAPINRFTELRNGSSPVKRTRRIPESHGDDAGQTGTPG
jgi:hypothetical protein